MRFSLRTYANAQTCLMFSGSSSHLEFKDAVSVCRPDSLDEKRVSRENLHSYPPRPSPLLTHRTPSHPIHPPERGIAPFCQMTQKFRVRRGARFRSGTGIMQSICFEKAHKYCLFCFSLAALTKVRSAC